MTADARCADGPTPDEARRLMPELTAVMLTDEPLTTAMTRTATMAPDTARAAALWRRWRREAAAECDAERGGVAASLPSCHCRRLGYSGLVTAVAVRECRDAVGDDDGRPA